jgi:hypothetical protein
MGSDRWRSAPALSSTGAPPLASEAVAVARSRGTSVVPGAGKTRAGDRERHEHDQEGAIELPARARGLTVGPSMDVIVYGAARGTFWTSPEAATTCATSPSEAGSTR